MKQIELVSICSPQNTDIDYFVKTPHTVWSLTVPCAQNCLLPGPVTHWSTAPPNRIYHFISENTPVPWELLRAPSQAFINVTSYMILQVPVRLG